jgi:ComF family protein
MNIQLLFYLKKTLEPIFFPYYCILCAQPADQLRDLCIDCDQYLPRLKQCCQQCAEPIVGASIASTFCGQCLKSPPSYDKTLALFEYKAPVSNLIAGLKFQKKLSYARLLGEMMGEWLLMQYQSSMTLPDCIIPIPLHYKKLRMRGFNQTLEIARPIAKLLKIPVLPFLHQRIKNTVFQAKMSLSQRRLNVKGVFVQKKVLPFKKVAILDDVMTTGSTVEQFSQMLRKNGAEEITIWCCARTCPS